MTNEHQIRMTSLSLVLRFITARIVMTKPLNIGLIGYGFMGRAHSNAYRRVNNFFDLDYRLC